MIPGNPHQLGREAADHLLQLAQHLATPDRLLLEQVYRHGMTVADVARLTRRCPRTVQRRVRRLRQRLRDPLFLYIVTHEPLLPPQLKATARHHILHGQPLRQVATRQHQSLHTVRQHLTALRALHHAAQHRAQVGCQI